MPKKVLAIFAHPDDESFGPGGTLAKWTGEGVEVRLLSATKGESGMNPIGRDTALVREEELRAAARLLGIREVKFMGFIDGGINNNDLAKLEEMIIEEIRKFNPDTLLTFDLNGISGHLDHIAVASATTQAFKKADIPEALYYYTRPKEWVNEDNIYFVNRPVGRAENEIDEIIDVSAYWPTKLSAMAAHTSQAEDMKRILEQTKNFPQREYFMVKRRSKS